ncbi:MAG: sulfatase-like hydrolase/transferase [Candidatus Hydrogenedentota bacterium]
MPFTRRDFLRVLGMSAAACAAPAGAFNMAAAQGKRPPNIIVILADDQGSLDANCYGAEDLYTPNIDALAKRGVRFTQFYVGAPVCSPSRACLLTGKYPHAAGVPGNVGQDNGLPNEQVTLAEVFKSAGYKTACFGKWHLGHKPELSPNAQGFDEFFGHKHGCIDNYSHFFYWSGPNRHDLWRNEDMVWEDGEFFPDLVVRESHRFIEENQDQPFFMFLPFNVPHYPYQGTEAHRERYEDMEHPRNKYAAFISTMDEKIGEVMGKVDELGLREDTIIVYLSDHGHSTEERAFFGGGWAGPYRGHKFTLWEGGIRVPCIISWPGTLPEGETRDQLGHSMDWLPTLAALAGVDPGDHKIDGLDISGVIREGAGSPHEVVQWDSGGSWAVREGPWKLVANGHGTTHRGKKLEKVPFFLSNLDEDVTETVNLADDHPEMVRRMRDLHREWKRSL